MKLFTAVIGLAKEYLDIFLREESMEGKKQRREREKPEGGKEGGKVRDGRKKIRKVFHQ